MEGRVVEGVVREDEAGGGEKWEPGWEAVV